MIYYTYRIQYTDNNGHPSSVSQTRACEDIDYPTSLDDTKLIVQQQAWALNNFDLVTTYTEKITNITLAQYSAIVLDPASVEPISGWDPNEPIITE